MASKVYSDSDWTLELASALGCHFEWVSTPNNAFQTPSELEEAKNSLSFRSAIVPGTVSQLVDDFEHKTRLDSLDHWYRAIFSLSPEQLKKRVLLQFDGLLTHTDIYLNDQLILQSRNAFHTHIVDVSSWLKPENRLHLCFRAITPLLEKKHPRARFPTRLVNERHLRFVRTPALGYMPGFASLAKLVGPYRSIRLISFRSWYLNKPTTQAKLDYKTGKAVGQVSMHAELFAIDEKYPTSGYLVLCDGQDEISRAKVDINQQKIQASLEAQGVQLYWPHTHGEPKRYDLKLELYFENQCIVLDIAKCGFRSIDYTFAAVKWNDRFVFLRGANWTPMDPSSLNTSEDMLRDRLSYLRDMGINMLRIPGNMPYEQDVFYEICDELGILIAQDFAFTNFDYPDTDTEFIENVRKEAQDFLTRHASHACLSMLLGNSEVAQQAVMMGIAIEDIKNDVFDNVIPDACKKYAANVPYFFSSPSAAGVPFHVGSGTSHYYGVGGYMRGYEDARLFKGKLIAECLAFSHVPEDNSLYAFFNNEFACAHEPRWKEGVPRDVGTGWDFSDITDFYLQKIFGINPQQLRATQPQRYLDYCRVTSMEVVERTISILRADSTAGRMVLVWLLQDLKSGAGWGYFDRLGRPKSAFYGLARASKTTTLLFVDEGLEGLAIYLAHDANQQKKYELEIILFTEEGEVFAKKAAPVELAPNTLQRITVDTFLGKFVDSSYAYRFGARGFVATVARLLDINGKVIVQREYVDPVLTQNLVADLDMSISAEASGGNQFLLTITTNKPTFFVSLELPDSQLSDNYFHVMPGFDRHIEVKSKNGNYPRGRARAFNAKKSAPILMQQSKSGS